MGEKKLPEPNSEGLIVLRPDQLIQLLREAFPQLAGNTQAPNEFMTIDEVATLLDVHRRTIRTWVNTEGLPAIPVGPVALRFRRADVIAWLESRAMKPSGPESRHVKRLKGAKL